MKTRTLALPGTPYADAARSLAHRVEQADGIAALSEQFVLGMSDPRLGHRHAVVTEGDRVIGVLALDKEAELAVDPARRRRGVATLLLDALPPASVWAHGNLPAAQALAVRRGMKPARRLLVLGIEGDALAAASRFSSPRGYELSNLEEMVKRLGRDRVLDAWLRVNNEAFSWHPEQGGWDRARLERGMETPWFDPGGVLFLIKEGEFAGFHWTKWHEGEGGLGEVYVVGLAQAYRGRHLGGPLLRAGLAHLVGRGARRVVLYVEADNQAALKAYYRLGFQVAEEHVVYTQDS